MTNVPAAEEEPMDRLDALALEMRAGFGEMRAEMRAGFAELRAEMRADIGEVRAETRAGFAETRAGLAEVRADVADFRVLQSERHATLIDAISDLRNEYRGHTHGD
jgi:hypothetical protein